MARKRNRHKRLYGTCCEPGCPHCAADRQHRNRKRQAAADEQVKEIDHAVNTGDLVNNEESRNNE